MSFYSRAADLQKLGMAWDKVKKNKPACGVDNMTWEMFDGKRKQLLKQLNISLVGHTYMTNPVRIVTLQKGDKEREVALYCMCDKVVQQSIAYELVRLYDGAFSNSVYAYRPRKSALTAIEEIEKKIQAGNIGWVLKMDIARFFDTICLDKLICILRQRIPEEDTLELIRKISAAPCLSDTGELAEKREGIYQGSVMSPVLSNIYLAEFDWIMENESDFYIRYSDDMVVFGRKRQQLEALLAKATLLLQKLGLTLNQAKTGVLSVGEGFEFMGYHFDRQGKAIPAKAEEKLQERLETMWLTQRNGTLQERLRKGAEILGGWEQYFRGERKIASAYEFAVVAYMTWNKEVGYGKLEENRSAFRNMNREICTYLYRFWEQNGSRKMMLYEMEDYHEVAALDKGTETGEVYAEELLHLYGTLIEEESEETLVNIMQIYSDAGCFNKAMVFMEKISGLHGDYEKERGSVRIKPAGEEAGEKESEAVRLTEPQLKKYMELFAGREDTYVVQNLDKYGKLCYEQKPEPLTEDILKKHFAGELTAGTYVQRGNSTARFMVIDVDVSKKVLLEVGNEAEKFRLGMQKAASQVQRIQEELKKLRLRGWVEESGHRGYHIWILFTEWVSVRYLNLLQDIVESRIGEMPDAVTIEFFPNKGRLKNGKAGQAIKLPFGYHAKTGRQSRFLDEGFFPVQNPGNFIMDMGGYTGLALKKVLNIAAPAKNVAVKENKVDEDLSSFGYLPDNTAVILKRCNLMRYLCQKARSTGYLSHFERLSVLYVFGHAGEDGKAFVHKVMEFTLNYQYSVTEKFISKLPAKPISCLKLRDQYQKVTAEYGCNCNFNRMKNCYPSPVLHAIKAGEEPGGEITVPTSRTLTKEKESKVFEELNINRRVQDITGRILEMKKQKRGIDKNIVRLEHELEAIFDEAGIDCLEVEFGILVRRKKGDGYEWVVEI